MLFFYFTEFYRFVRPHHKKQFHQMCLDLTGLSTSYKPEDTVNKKRLREESGSNSSGKAKENAMYISGFPQALEIMENLENHKKVQCMEKSWNLKKKTP